MTDHMEAAIEAGARAYDPEAWTAYDRESPSTEGRELMVEYSKSKAESILAAAEPHLRKKWAEELARRVEASNLGAPLRLDPDGTAHIASGPEMRALLCEFILKGAGE